MYLHHTSFLVGLGLFAGSGLTSVLPAYAGQHCVICEGPSATYLCAAENGPGILVANGGQLLCIREMAKRGGHEKCAVMRGNTGRCEGLAPTVLYPDMSDSAFEAAETPPDTRPPQPPNTASEAPSQNFDPNMPAAPSADSADIYTPDDDGLGRGDTTPADQKVARDKAKTPPKTVVEMADRAYETSKKGVNDAGEAVTETAKSAGKVVTDTAKKTGDQIGKAGKAIGDGAKKVWTCMTSLFSDC